MQALKLMLEPVTVKEFLPFLVSLKKANLAVGVLAGLDEAGYEEVGQLAVVVVGDVISETDQDELIKKCLTLSAPRKCKLESINRALNSTGKIWFCCKILRMMSEMKLPPNSETICIVCSIIIQESDLVKVAFAWRSIRDVDVIHWCDFKALSRVISVLKVLGETNEAKGLLERSLSHLTADEAIAIRKEAVRIWPGLSGDSMGDSAATISSGAKSGLTAATCASARTAEPPQNIGGEPVLSNEAATILSLIRNKMKSKREQFTSLDCAEIISKRLDVGCTPETALEVLLVFLKIWDGKIEAQLFNTTIRAFVEDGNIETAEGLLALMGQSGVSPDVATFGILLKFALSKIFQFIFLSYWCPDSILIGPT